MSSTKEYPFNFLFFSFFSNLFLLFLLCFVYIYRGCVLLLLLFFLVLERLLWEMSFINMIAIGGFRSPPRLLLSSVQVSLALRRHCYLAYIYTPWVVFLTIEYQLIFQAYYHSNTCRSRRMGQEFGRNCLFW